MDAELIQAIEQHFVDDPNAEILDPDEAERLRRAVAERFGFTESKVWWWEELPAEAKTISYQEQGGLSLLAGVLPATASRLFLFVTDDSRPPWPCISADAAALVELVRAQRFFEYFVVDATLDWIVFDTHHNALVCFGDRISAKGLGL